MGRFRFELAAGCDDAELRAILAATPMAGQVSLAFHRDPSFFEAAIVGGDFQQVVVCRDQHKQRIAGFGCRSVREMYVNGRPQPIGYLSTLRALPEYRSLGLVARGYAYFYRLHGDGRTPLYLTTIAAGNERALNTLTTGRAGLPDYTFAGNYHTLVLPIRGGRWTKLKGKSPIAINVHPATLEDRNSVLNFLRTYGPARQFFPCYQAGDLFAARGVLRGLTPGDLQLAFRGDRLVGVLGCWNQSSFRQSVVHGYSGPMRWTRPWYNCLARLRGWPKLPATGEAFRYLTAALSVVKNDDSEVFRTLLEHALDRGGSGSHDYLLLGLHETDPLWPVAKVYQSGSYTTKLYLVCWEQRELERASLDGRPLYLELGSL